MSPHLIKWISYVLNLSTNLRRTLVGLGSSGFLIYFEIYSIALEYILVSVTS